MCKSNRTWKSYEQGVVSKLNCIVELNFQYELKWEEEKKSVICAL